jgi:energy-coupling factor transport system permease protein
VSASFEWAFSSNDGPLERWDPRVKILSTLFVAVALVVHNEPWLKAVQVLLLVALWGWGRLYWMSLGALVLALIPWFATTAASQFLSRSYIATPWVSAALLDLQIFGVVVVLTLLVRSTAPTSLAEGLERLLEPLQRRRLPVHEAVLMFSIALRFIPLLLEEFRAISRAQTVRGGGLVRRGLWSRATSLPALIVPLFVLSILRAQALAEAMESRCYHGAEGRTPLAVRRWTPADWAVGAVSLGNLTVSFVFAFLPGPGAGKLF